MRCRGLSLCFVAMGGARGIEPRAPLGLPLRGCQPLERFVDSEGHCSLHDLA